MSNFFIGYYMGENPTMHKDESKQMMEFQTWLEGLGDVVVNPGTPLNPTNTIQSDGNVTEGSQSRLTGFSVVKADSIEAAVDMVKECPFLKMGTLEVAEMMEK
jgi:hypothetical protein